MNTLSIEELKFINENEDKQDDFIDSLPLVKERSKILNDIVTQIENLAGEFLRFVKNKISQFF